MNRLNTVKFTSWIILIVLTVIWGSSFILIKKGLYDDQDIPVFSADQVGALRIVFAGLSLLPIALFNLRKVKKEQYLWLMLVGLLGNTIPSFLFAFAETKVSSAVAGMLNGTTAIFTFLVAVIVFKARFLRENIYGVVIGFLGSIGLIYLTSSEDITITRYAFLLLIATLCYGISVNIMKMKLKEVKSLTLTAVSLGMMVIPCVLYLFFQNPIDITQLDDRQMTSVGYILILSLVGTSFALIIFNYLVKRESVLFASSVTYLIPIVAILWGIADDETIGWGQIAMIGVILSGVFLVNKKEVQNQ